MKQNNKLAPWLVQGALGCVVIFYEYTFNFYPCFAPVIFDCASVNFKEF